MILTPLQIDLALTCCAGLSALLAVRNFRNSRLSESWHSRSYYRTQAVLDCLIAVSLIILVIL